MLASALQQIEGWPNVEMNAGMLAADLLLAAGLPVGAVVALLGQEALLLADHRWYLPMGPLAG